MADSAARPHTLETSAGDFTLQEYQLCHRGRQWSVLHTGVVLSRIDESRVIGEKDVRLPYGVALWPSAIALAHDLAGRESGIEGQSVLELGAGTGLPGIVAASLGARVVQTDRDELAMLLCRRNGERNGVEQVEYRLADWSAWDDTRRYDWIIGADILYGESLHSDLRRIFHENLERDGRILIADPFRTMSLRFFEAMEAEGWAVRFNKWDVGDERPVGVFELAPTGASV